MKSHPKASVHLQDSKQKSLKNQLVAFAWSTRDWMTTTLLGVSYGLLYIGGLYLYKITVASFLIFLTHQGVLSSSSLTIFKETFNGFWFGAGILLGAVIRKPGAALLGETVAALLELHWVFLEGLYLGIFQGLGSELAFALGRYKRLHTFIWILAGALPAVCGFLYQYKLKNYGQFPIWVQATKLSARMLSGVVFGSMVAKRLHSSLKNAGLLQHQR